MNSTEGVEPAPDQQGAGKRRSSLNLWAFTPFIVIGLAMIPNAIKIVRAQSTPAHSVEEQPWEASRSFDEQQAARELFVDSGLTLVFESSADGAMLLRLSGPAGFASGRLQEVEVFCYRPDHPEMDRTLQWQSGQTVLDLSMLPVGSWVLTVSGKLDDKPIRHTLRASREAQSS